MCSRSLLSFPLEYISYSSSMLVMAHEWIWKGDPPTSSSHKTRNVRIGVNSIWESDQQGPTIFFFFFLYIYTKT